MHLGLYILIKHTYAEDLLGVGWEQVGNGLELGWNRIIIRVVSMLDITTFD